jgi:hypothetical protein
MGVRSVLIAAGACAWSLTAPASADSNKKNLAQPAEQRGVAPYTNFCCKEYLKEKEGKLFCNWSPSFGGACITANYGNSYIEKDAVVSKEEVGQCSTSHAVVLKVVSN